MKSLKSSYLIIWMLLTKVFEANSKVITFERLTHHKEELTAKKMYQTKQFKRKIASLVVFSAVIICLINFSWKKNPKPPSTKRKKILKKLKTSIANSKITDESDSQDSSDSASDE